jgi:hypothetical protein
MVMLGFPGSWEQGTYGGVWVQGQLERRDIHIIVARFSQERVMKVKKKKSSVKKGQLAMKTRFFWKKD